MQNLLSLVSYSYPANAYETWQYLDDSNLLNSRKQDQFVVHLVYFLTLTTILIRIQVHKVFNLVIPAPGFELSTFHLWIFS